MEHDQTASSPTEPVPLVLIDKAEMCRRLGGMATSTFYGLIKAGVVPHPVKIGSMSRWLEADCDAVVERLSKDARQVPVEPAALQRARADRVQASVDWKSKLRAKMAKAQAVAS